MLQNLTKDILLLSMEAFSSIHCRLINMTAVTPFLGCSVKVGGFAPVLDLLPKRFWKLRSNPTQMKSTQIWHIVHPKRILKETHIMTRTCNHIEKLNRDKFCDCCVNGPKTCIKALANMATQTLF